MAEAQITGGKIKITSKSPGTVTITVLDANYNEATIKVKVNANGSITVAAKDIVKYDPASPPPAGSFPVTDNSIANTEAVLGLIGEAVDAAGSSAISAAITGGKITITATASGAATLTVKAGDINEKPGHRAVIGVVVSAGGKIITSITRYEAPSPKGRTYMSWNTKYVFEPSTGTSGVVTCYANFYDNGQNDYVLEGGKFKYWPTMTGTYSYNAAAKTVIITPTKIAEEFDEDEDGYPGYTEPFTRSQLQARYTQWWNSLSKAEQDAEKQEFPNQSFAEALKESLDADFAPRTYDYSFSLDESVLFLDEKLPTAKGTNELSGKTFELGWYDNGEWQPATGSTIEFTATKYEVKYNGTVRETGSYSYDTSNTSSEGKRVYLKVDEVSVWTGSGYSLMTRSEYYDAIKDDDVSNNYYGTAYFANADEYKQAQVNDNFDMNASRYTLNPNRVRN